MNVLFGYVGVILIWSTTPLGIQWSANDIHFVAAISWRIILAAALGVAILKLARIKLVEHRSDWLIFAVSALGLFPTMLFVYWAAGSVPSGLMSVIFGCFPFFAGLWSYVFLNEQVFTARRVIALCIALLGLVLINFDRLAFDIQGVWGVLAIVLATALWSLSSVLLKRLPSISPFRQSIGASVVSSPFYLIALMALVWYGDAQAELIPLEGGKSLIALIYLIVAASLVGHALFFFVLNHCSVGSVALIPLLAPVIALLLGYFVQGEVISLLALCGAGLVVVAVAIYQGIGRSNVLYLVHYVLKRSV